MLKTAVEQGIGRERETATFLKALCGEFYVACSRFRAASIPPLGTFLLNVTEVLHAS